MAKVYNRILSFFYLKRFILHLWVLKVQVNPTMVLLYAKLFLGLLRFEENMLNLRTYYRLYYYYYL